VRPRFVPADGTGGGTTGFGGAAGFGAAADRPRIGRVDGGPLIAGAGAAATAAAATWSTSLAVAFDQACSDPQAGHRIRATTGFNF
jgi:hypothetical protein